MQFQAVFADGSISEPWQIFSVGGGALAEEEDAPPPAVYDLDSLADILTHCRQTGQSLWEYVEEREGKEIWTFLARIAEAMGAAIEQGLVQEGVLPGGLGVARTGLGDPPQDDDLGQCAEPVRAAVFLRARRRRGERVLWCGGNGADLRFKRRLARGAPLRPGDYWLLDDAVLRALATAGLIGNLVKHNASILGRRSGLPGRSGAWPARWPPRPRPSFSAGTVRQIEYAAEMGLEHNLGLTCDPVAGMVQIPCIERNAFAASKAFKLRGLRPVVRWLAPSSLRRRRRRPLGDRQQLALFVSRDVVRWVGRGYRRRTARK